MLTYMGHVDWDAWFYKPGYPPKPDFDQTLVKACFKLAQDWKTRSGSASAFKPSKNDIEAWSANQLVVFLEQIQTFTESISPSDVELMGATYGFAKSQNVEVVSRYYGIGLKSKAKAVYQPTAELLGKVGRMKFVRPLFKLLNEVDRKLAVETFEKNKDFYHPICR